MKGAKIGALLWALCVSHGAWAQERHFDLAPMDAIHGIPEFARQAGLQIVAPADDLGGISTPAIRGNLDVRMALKKLLVGTELEIASDDGAVITLRKRSRAQTSFPKSSSSDAQSSPDAAGSGRQSPVDVDGLTGHSLEEIIVTAQKRAERLQDVPESITVLDPKGLAINGANRLEDYYYEIPGLSVTKTLFPGSDNVSIRGISSGNEQNPTVAVVIDDVPIGSSTVTSRNSRSLPDLDPSDLSDIEVLKGPQGALYGANSIGGLIKYDTTDPSTDAATARIEETTVDIPAGGLGYAVRAAGNLPVSDTFAVRASAFSREDPGYIDDLTTGERNANTTHSYGGRLSILWRPSEDFSVKMAAMYQGAHGLDGFVNSDVSFGFPQGDLNMTGLPGTPYFNTQNQLYYAVMDGTIKGVKLTSITSYGIYRYDERTDVSGCCTALFGTSYYPSATAAYTESIFQTNKFTQEIRAASAFGSWLEWRVGGFYTDEQNPTGSGGYYAANLKNGSTVGPTYVIDQSYRFSEYALFLDLSAHLSKQLTIEFGGREEGNSQSLGSVTTGPAVQDFDGTPPPEFQPTAKSSGTGFTYQTALKYRVSDDLMAYGRIATGYGPGGVNSGAQAAFLVGIVYPSSYPAEKVTNYEVGLKGDFWNHKLDLDVAAYHINWTDFQIEELVTGSNGVVDGFTANAGDAKSDGIELALMIKLTQGLTIKANGNIQNAVLTQNLPTSSSAFGYSGERLPYSMRYSGGVTINQDIPLQNDWIGYIGGGANYIDSRPLEFVSSEGAVRAVAPSYTLINLHAGSRYKAWTANLFINNVTDRRGIEGLLGVPAYGVTGGYYASVITPRAVGLSLVKNF